MDIIDPVSLQKYNITSKFGREVLKKYINCLITGGVTGRAGVGVNDPRKQTAPRRPTTRFVSEESSEYSDDVDEKTDFPNLEKAHFLFDTTHDLYEYFNNKKSFWNNSINSVEKNFNNESSCEYMGGVECKYINQSGKLFWPQIVYGNIVI